MKRLLQVLAVLLAVHVGFVQAGMVHAPLSEPAATQSDAAEAMPCHHHGAPESLPPSDDLKHKNGCCDAGGCHCAAACGMPFASMAMTPSEAAGAPGFILQSVLAVMSAPDLRPPIL